MLAENRGKKRSLWTGGKKMEIGSRRIEINGTVRK